MPFALCQCTFVTHMYRKIRDDMKNGDTREFLCDFMMSNVADHHTTEFWTRQAFGLLLHGLYVFMSCDLIAGF